MTLQDVYDVLQPLGITNQGFKNLMRWCANKGKLVELQATIQRMDLQVIHTIINLSNNGDIFEKGGEVL